jgi:DNA-binding transcriptional ArsR family regulator
LHHAQRRRRCSTDWQTARLSCLLTVRGHPHTVSEIVAVTWLFQPNVFKHLACLRDCGLVKAARCGRYVLYRLAHADIERLLQAAEALVRAVGETGAVCPTYGQGTER